MDIVLVPFLGLGLFLILLAFGHRRPDCPDCGRPLPSLESPFAKTWRMWLEGGYRCPNFGCEADLAGAKVVVKSK